MPEILKHEHDLKDRGMVAGSRTTHIRRNPLERNMLVLKSVKQNRSIAGQHRSK
jgi:hypothetical protein